jgi:diguanylate cyclase (GGDEF)-like protein
MNSLPDDLYRIIVTHLSVAALVVDNEGRVRFANPAVITLVGAEQVGRPVAEMFVDRDVATAFVRSALARWPDDAATSFEAMIVTASGELRLVEVQSTVVSEPTFNGLVVALIDRTAEGRRAAALEAALMTDPLTGLLNRRALDLRLREARIEGRRGALAYVDIDSFKNVNDRFGHAFGDELLARVAQHLVTTLPRGTLLCRFGGDEFIALISGVTVSEACSHLVASLDAMLEWPRLGGDLLVSFSAGVTEFDDRSVAAIIREADVCLYEAKMNGRCRVVSSEEKAILRGIAQAEANAAVISRLHDENTALKTEARTDALTGLLNRRALDEVVARGLADRSPVCAVLFIDIDHFGAYNGHYGYDGGDLVLRRVAAVLADGARDTDIAFRKGGEEFVVLLPGVDAARALSAGRRLRDAIVELEIVHAASPTSSHLTVTIGVACGPVDRLEALLRAAGDRVITAKNDGQRNAVHEASC